MGKDKQQDRNEELDVQHGDYKVGKPYDTDRELVEEGPDKREGTNLDLGEERSKEQKRERGEALKEHQSGKNE